MRIAPLPREREGGGEEYLLPRYFRAVQYTLFHRVWNLKQWQAWLMNPVSCGELLYGPGDLVVRLVRGGGCAFR